MAYADINKKRANERRHYQLRRASIPARVAQLVIDGRRRAKNRSIPFSLSQAWIRRAKKQDACAVTGILFDLSKRKGAPNPLGPSLDRIDSSKGYTDKNTRLVIYFVNTAKSDMTDEQFRTLVLVAASNMRH